MGQTDKNKFKSVVNLLEECFVTNFVEVNPLKLKFLELSEELYKKSVTQNPIRNDLNNLIAKKISKTINKCHKKKVDFH